MEASSRGSQKRELRKPGSEGSGRREVEEKALLYSAPLGYHKDGEGDSHRQSVRIYVLRTVGVIPLHTMQHAEEEWLFQSICID